MKKVYVRNYTNEDPIDILGRVADIVENEDVFCLTTNPDEADFFYKSIGTPECGCYEVEGANLEFVRMINL